MINSRCPNITSVLTLLWATPCFLFASSWFFVWLPAYATARISDLSWGNRDNGSDKQDSKVAKHRAKVGKMVIAALVSSNFAVFGISICLLHQVPGSLHAMVFFSIGISSLTYIVAFIDMLIRLVGRLVPVFCCSVCSICTLAKSMRSVPPVVRHRISKCKHLRVISLCLLSIILVMTGFSIWSSEGVLAGDISKKKLTARIDERNLNFLAFGTSRTRGNGLLNPEKEASL